MADCFYILNQGRVVGNKYGQRDEGDAEIIAMKLAAQHPRRTYTVVEVRSKFQWNLKEKL